MMKFSVARRAETCYRLSNIILMYAHEYYGSCHFVNGEQRIVNSIQMILFGQDLDYYYYNIIFVYCIQCDDAISCWLYSVNMKQSKTIIFFPLNAE